MLEKLIKMADNLDRLGLEKEAEAIDALIEKYAQQAGLPATPPIAPAQPMTANTMVKAPAGTKQKVTDAFNYVVGARKKLNEAMEELRRVDQGVSGAPSVQCHTMAEGAQELPRILNYIGNIVKRLS